MMLITDLDLSMVPDQHVQYNLDPGVERTSGGVFQIYQTASYDPDPSSYALTSMVNGVYSGITKPTTITASSEGDATLFATPISDTVFNMYEWTGWASSMPVKRFEAHGMGSSAGYFVSVVAEADYTIPILTPPTP